MLLLKEPYVHRSVLWKLYHMTLETILLLDGGESINHFVVFPLSEGIHYLHTNTLTIKDYSARHLTFFIFHQVYVHHLSVTCNLGLD